MGGGAGMPANISLVPVQASQRVSDMDMQLLPRQATGGAATVRCKFGSRASCATMPGGRSMYPKNGVKGQLRDDARRPVARTCTVRPWLLRVADLCGTMLACRSAEKDSSGHPAVVGLWRQKSCLRLQSKNRSHPFPSIITCQKQTPTNEFLFFSPPAPAPNPSADWLTG